MLVVGGGVVVFLEKSDLSKGGYMFLWLYV